MHGEVTMGRRLLLVAFGVIALLAAAGGVLAAHLWVTMARPGAAAPPPATETTATPAVAATGAGAASPAGAGTFDGGADPASPPPGPAPAPPSGPFTAAFAAFPAAEQAEAMAAALGKRGVAATAVALADATGRQWFHVVSGSFASRGEAVAAAAAFAAALGLESAPLRLDEAAP